ncbi:unnamed protein product [Orchesella dallaii]|uniref:Cytochrome P450 n=1 Tax=Orchesella dallaii TaxID=48710 RepID=A0ABP1QB06_9HEXA
MTFPVVGLVVATVLLVWFLYSRRKSNKNKNLKALPGPTGLPIIGNLLQIGKNPNEQFCKWAKQYGDIYQAKICQNLMVVVSNPKLCKEIFSTDPAFAGRPQFGEFGIYEDEFLGIINSEGDLWEVHRRFLLRQLRDFGFGKSAMETKIIEELNEVLGKFKAQEGKPITKLRETLRLALVNSLWTILANQRFDQDDPQLLKLALNTSDTFNELLEDGALILFMPWVKYLIPEKSGYNAIRGVLEENKTFFAKVVAEHKRDLQEDNLRDFIDVYLAEVRKANEDANSHFHGTKAERQLVATLFDLFLAGSDTTATTLSWTMLLLSKFPETQKKLQQEVDEITGSSRKVSVDDRPNMPYMNALLEEILRFSTIVPDGVAHRSMSDREFHGYHIPKGAIIQPNLYYIHFDPKIWGDPENFRPERFLSADGTKFKKNENMQAFQVGRRQCVGETLARDTLFLYITNIFQQFSTELDASSKDHDLKVEVGFVRAPTQYTVIMKDRLNK